MKSPVGCSTTATCKSPTQLLRCTRRCHEHNDARAGRIGWLWRRRLRRPLKEGLACQDYSLGLTGRHGPLEGGVSILEGASTDLYAIFDNWQDYVGQPQKFCPLVVLCGISVQTSGQVQAYKSVKEVFKGELSAETTKAAAAFAGDAAK